MKWFTTVAVSAMFTILFLSCEGTKTTTKDIDNLPGDEDTLLADESVNDEEEPEGEETLKDDGPVTHDDGPVAKDDGPVAHDDGPVVNDDAPVLTDDGTVEPDEDVIVTDEVVTDEVVTDEVVTDEVVTDDTVTDNVITDDVVTDDVQPDNDQVETFTIGWCNLQYPADATVTEGDHITYYGRVYIAGLTDLTAEVDVRPEVIGQLSGNPSSGVDASTWPADGWLDMIPNPDNETAIDIGNNDEYMLEVPVMAGPGVMDITIRFSGDGGATWTYCNANREPSYNGTDTGNPYDPARHGHLTITAAPTPCDSHPCTEPHKTVCAVTETEPYYVCSCDSDAHDDGTGTCVPNMQTVPCTNEKGGGGSHWVNTGPYNGDGTVTQTWNGDGWEPAADTCPWACLGGYHWNDDEGSCLETLVIGWCNTQWPTDVPVPRGSGLMVYGRVYVAGLTDQSTEVDTTPQLIAEVGYGPRGTDATMWDEEVWGPMEPNPDNELVPGIGNNDEYQFLAFFGMPLGDYDYLVRFSGDSGATWTFCNYGGGTTADIPYDPAQNGRFVVETACSADPCQETHKTTCADSDEEPYYTCMCDDGYHDDKDTCVSDMRTVPCTNSKPDHSRWVNTGPYSGEPDGTVTQTWDGDSWEPAADSCPWVCELGYHYETLSEQCVSNTIVHMCQNTPPTGAVWVQDGPYNGNGTVTRTWVGPGDDDWDPPLSDPCPWECPAGKHYETSSAQCVSNTIVHMCQNTLPTDAEWVQDGPYNGDGTVTRTWVGPGDDDWNPPLSDPCPWDCDYGYRKEGDTCVFDSQTVPCTNEKGDGGSHWVNTGPYNGDGTVTQTWDGDSWEPAADTCPWACLGGYHWNEAENSCLETLVIGWCNLQWPPTISQPRGSTVSVYGQLWIDGITNNTIIDTMNHTVSPYYPQIKAQLGAGSRGIDPTTWSDHWMDAVPNVDAGNNDEYMASPVLDMSVGFYDYAFRFSGDSGTTWTYCDLNGSNDGYTTEQSGKLEVLCSSDDDCADNPDAPICGPTNICVECGDDSDCADPAAYCDATYTCIVPPIGKFADWPLTTDAVPTNAATEVDAHDFQMGADLTFVVASGNYSNASGWTTNASPASEAYFQISLAPKPGYKLLVTDVAFSERRSGTGPRLYQVQYSKTADFSSPTVIATVNVPDDTNIRVGDISGLEIAVGAGESLYLRWYGYAAEATTGTWRLVGGTTSVRGRIYPVLP